MNITIIINHSTCRSDSEAEAASVAPTQNTTVTSNSFKMTMCPEKNINAYAIFHVLEKQRILELRELYRQRLDAPSVNGSSSVQVQTPQEHSRATLPKLPPRYQHLKVSTNWLMLQLRKQRPTSRTSDEYRALDNVTKTFLDDTVRVLLDEQEENAIIKNFCSKLCFMPRNKRRSSIKITPPSSPRRAPRVTLTEEEPPVMSLSKPLSDSIHEVDLTDEQIMTIYETSEPSGDAVVINL